MAVLCEEAFEGPLHLYFVAGEFVLVVKMKTPGGTVVVAVEAWLFVVAVERAAGFGKIVQGAVVAISEGFVGIVDELAEVEAEVGTELGAGAGAGKGAEVGIVVVVVVGIEMTGADLMKQVLA
jgi:hypothetical protein